MTDQPQMHPIEHLLKYAEGNRMQIADRRKHVEALADSMKQHGYDYERGSQHLIQEHQYRDLGEAQIQLHYTDKGGFLHEGNHRVHAGNLAGLTHLPAVVRDFRSSGLQGGPAPEKGNWVT